MTLPERPAPRVLPRSGIGGLWSPCGPDPSQRLMICIHGGGHTHRYFDVPGSSMVAAANAAGFDVFAVDRPDHGSSPRLPKGEQLIMRNARALCAFAEELLAEQGGSDVEVMVVGHSIGGAVAVCMASLAPAWLRGIAISGVGLRPSASTVNSGKRMPPLRKLPMPAMFMRKIMLGPPGSYDPEHARLSLKLGLTAGVRQEIVEIGNWWPSNAPALAAQVKVPVDATLGEYDALWLADVASTAAFGALFAQSPRVVSDSFKGAGHSIDHHLNGHAFQQRQLAFAQACVRARP